MTLIGTYNCKIDTKGRFSLPTPLKKQLENQQSFILKRSVFQPCIELYPVDQWEKVIKKINKLNRFIKKNNDFIRRFTAGVKMVEIDKNARLLIAKDLLDFSSIKKEIVLSSAVNIIEIWDQSKYEQAIESSVDDFALLAEQVMGNLKEDDDE